MKIYKLFNSDVCLMEDYFIYCDIYLFIYGFGSFSPPYKAR